MFSFRTIVVIGGSGFLGKALLQKLQQQSPQTKLISLARSLPKDRLHFVEYRQGNLLHVSGLSDLLADADAIVNCSGVVSFLRKDYHQRQEANITGVRNLVETANHLPQLQKMIHISSTAAFGAQSGDFSESSAPLFSPKNPSLPYAHSKFLGDQEFLNARFPFHLVFPSFLIDESEKEKIKRKIRKMPFLIFPSGSNGFLHVEEAAEKIAHILWWGKPREHFLISGKTLSFAEIPKKWRIQKPQILLSDFWQKPALFCANILESWGFSISTEMVFFAFQKRNPQEKAFSEQFPEFSSDITKRFF